MTEYKPFEGAPTDTEERIMRATFRALMQYGYAGLSIGRIADETELSKSSVYHFYDGKDDLLAAFLDFMIEQWREEFAFDVSGDPVQGLRAYLTYAITGSIPQEAGRGDPDGGAFFGPYIELRAQAVNNGLYRQRFTRFEAVFHGEIASIIERGVETGVFRDVDPERAAELILTLVMGAILRRTTVEEFDAATVEEEVEAVLDRYLMRED